MNNLLSTSQSEFEQAVLGVMFSSFAAKKVRYAVLRNYEKLPISVGARDIDIIVYPEDLTSACSVVDAIAEKMNLRYGNYFQDERLTQYVLVGRDDLLGLQQIKIDFFTRSEVYGVELLSAETMLNNVRMHNGIPVVSDAVQIADKWLFHLLVGRPLHVKYNDFFAKIGSKEVSSLMSILAGFLPNTRAEELIAELTNGKGSTTFLTGIERRLALFRLWQSQGIVAAQRSVQMLYFRFRDYLLPHGIFISVSGPDGSGKTTVIDMVITQLEAIYGESAVHYAHYRPTILPRIAEIAKSARVVKTVDKNYAQPHRAKPSGLLGSLVRLCYYSLDYLGGYFKMVRPLLKRREVVLFDRYCFDMVADSTRSRIALPMFMLRWILRLLPLPKYSFFIHVDAYEIFRRKEELGIDKIIELTRITLFFLRADG